MFSRFWWSRSAWLVFVTHGTVDSTGVPASKLIGGSPYQPFRDEARLNPFRRGFAVPYSKGSFLEKWQASGSLPHQVSRFSGFFVASTCEDGCVDFDDLCWTRILPKKYSDFVRVWVKFAWQAQVTHATGMTMNNVRKIWETRWSEYCIIIKPNMLNSCWCKLSNIC